MVDLRKLAKGKECQLRLHHDNGHAICNFDSSTVVLCHVRIGLVGGMGRKPPDLCGLYACSECHAVIDRRNPVVLANLDRDILAALVRTLSIVSKELGLG